MENREFKKNNKRVLGGIFLIGVGAVLFLKQLGFPFPTWLFQWPVILIIIGFFLGLRHGFRGPAWIILMALGTLFVIDFANPQFSLQDYTAPVIVAAIGISMILRPRRFRNRNYYDPSGYYKSNAWQRPDSPQPGMGNVTDETYAKDDYLDAVSFFGHVRKVVVSKNFKGGDMVAFFGGNEIDLSQADINGRVVLDVTQIFGGTKLILPSNWDVKSEMVAFFGGIEDKRTPLSTPLGMPGNDPLKPADKVLFLQGTSIFGGIEIRNY